MILWWGTCDFNDNSNNLLKQLWPTYLERTRLLRWPEDVAALPHLTHPVIYSSTSFHLQATLQPAEVTMNVIWANQLCSFSSFVFQVIMTQVPLQGKGVWNSLQPLSCQLCPTWDFTAKNHRSETLTGADCVHILRQVRSPHVNGVFTARDTNPP